MTSGKDESASRRLSFQGALMTSGNGERQLSFTGALMTSGNEERKLKGERRLSFAGSLMTSGEEEGASRRLSFNGALMTSGRSGCASRRWLITPFACLRVLVALFWLCCSRRWCDRFVHHDGVRWLWLTRACSARRFVHDDGGWRGILTRTRSQVRSR